MNLDFILFSAPKAKYSFVDFWGEVIFVPSHSHVPLQQTHKKTSFLQSFTNCYRANKSTQVYFTVDSALSQQMGQMAKIQSELGTADSANQEQQNITHYIPCLYLNSMVGSKYLILYFHSSGEDLKTAHGLLNYIRNSYQANVISVQYPGYSIYKGSSSSKQANQDAKVVYEFVISKLGFQQNNIIVIGRSIGTGIALQLLKNPQEKKSRNPRCLVLISPFASVKNLVSSFVGRIGTLIAKQTFDNLNNIMGVSCPVFIVHGQKDTLIPLDHSKQLIKNCYNRKVLITPEKMTHSTFDYYSDLVDPLRQFLIEEGVNFYQQNMKGPTPPEQLFNLPQNFNF